MAYRNQSKNHVECVDLRQPALLRNEELVHSIGVELGGRAAEVARGGVQSSGLAMEHDHQAHEGDDAGLLDGDTGGVYIEADLDGVGVRAGRGNAAAAGLDQERHDIGPDEDLAHRG